MRLGSRGLGIAGDGQLLLCSVEQAVGNEDHRKIDDGSGAVG